MVVCTGFSGFRARRTPLRSKGAARDSPARPGPSARRRPEAPLVLTKPGLGLIISKSMAAASLPDELLARVLSPVDLKSLVQARAVCKSWQTSVEGKQVSDLRATKPKNMIMPGASRWTRMETCTKWRTIGPARASRSSRRAPPRWSWASRRRRREPLANKHKLY